MKTEEVINKLRQLKLDYVKQKVGQNPAVLPSHLAEFLGYATILYDHYAEFIQAYRQLEYKVLSEESDDRAEALEAGKRVSMAEMERNITLRIAEVKGKRERLEAVVKGVTLHINGCQSLMRSWGDEAKGVR